MESSLSISSISILPQLGNPRNRHNRMNDFTQDSLLPKYSLKASKAKEFFYRKKIKTQISPEDIVDSPSLSTLDLSRLQVAVSTKNMNFIRKRLQQIRTSSIGKLNKKYRTQLNLTENSNPLSVSRENLCRSVMKKISSKISSDKVSSERQVFSQGCSAIRVNFSFFDNQISNLSADKNKSGQRIRKSLDAYAKNQNERVLRLFQKQQELEERYSALKVNLKRKMESNAEKRLSKKDLYLYSRSLQTNRPATFQMKVSRKKLKNP